MRTGYVERADIYDLQGNDCVAEIEYTIFEDTKDGGEHYEHPEITSVTVDGVDIWGSMAGEIEQRAITVAEQHLNDEY